MKVNPQVTLENIAYFVLHFTVKVINKGFNFKMILYKVSKEKLISSMKWHYNFQFNGVYFFETIPFSILSRQYNFSSKFCKYGSYNFSSLWMWHFMANGQMKSLRLLNNLSFSDSQISIVRKRINDSQLLKTNSLFNCRMLLIALDW